MTGAGEEPGDWDQQVSRSPLGEQGIVGAGLGAVLQCAMLQPVVSSSDEGVTKTRSQWAGWG